MSTARRVSSSDSGKIISFLFSNEANRELNKGTVRTPVISVVFILRSEMTRRCMRRKRTRGTKKPTTNKYGCTIKRKKLKNGIIPY